MRNTIKLRATSSLGSTPTSCTSSSGSGQGSGSLQAGGEQPNSLQSPKLIPQMEKLPSFAPASAAAMLRPVDVAYVDFFHALLQVHL